MPSFSARFSVGTTLEPWLDADDDSGSGRPSRLNATSTRPHKRRRGTVGELVTITVSSAGLGEAPLDETLEDLLFKMIISECPLRPVLSSAPAQSSVQSFTPRAAGHYTIVVRREGGFGAVILHLDVLPEAL